MRPTFARRARWWGSRASSLTNRFGKTISDTVPVFNLVPAQGEPARFGFEVAGKIPIVIDTSVRTGRDYGVVARVTNATEVAGLLSSQVTLWGVPGDSQHNASRGWECVSGGVFQNQIGKPCPVSSEVVREPFLTLPTSCAASPGAEPVQLLHDCRLVGGSRRVHHCRIRLAQLGGRSARLRRLRAAPVHTFHRGQPRTAHREHADGAQRQRRSPAEDHAGSGWPRRGGRAQHHRHAARRGGAEPRRRRRARSLLGGADRLRRSQPGKRHPAVHS